MDTLVSSVGNFNTPMMLLSDIFSPKCTSNYNDGIVYDLIEECDSNNKDSFAIADAETSCTDNDNSGSQLVTVNIGCGRYANDLLWEQADEEFWHEDWTDLYADESFIDISDVSNNDIGVQTTSISIARFPVDSNTHPIPWGLATDKPSPLTVPDHMKLKLEDSLMFGGSDEDIEFLTNIFDFLKSSDRKYEDSLLVSGSKDSILPLKKRLAFDNEDFLYYISNKYEGVVEVDLCNKLSRTVATNTIHIPDRIAEARRPRASIWRRSSKRFLDVRT